MRGLLHGCLERGKRFDDGAVAFPGDANLEVAGFRGVEVLAEGSGGRDFRRFRQILQIAADEKEGEQQQSGAARIDAASLHA